MTKDVPPCPHCGAMPSPTGCFQSWDLRGLPDRYASDEVTIEATVPILTFCSKTCAHEFWEEVAEELKAERIDGR